MAQKNKNKKRILVIALILALIILNYPFLDKALTNFLNEDEEIHVARVIDGDTIQYNKTSVRLLGINSPEAGEFGYEEAKGFLKKEILNKTVTLKFTNERTDKYGRTLAYIFLGNKNVNVESVRNGYSNYYFYSGKDVYSNDLISAWNECINSNKNLCEKSNNSCGKCVNIGNSSSFIVNTCGFSCNISGWVIEGEGRDTFMFENKVLSPMQKAVFSLNLTDSSGAIFLRDEKGKLVVWKSS